MKTHIDAAAEKLRSSKNSFYRYINPVTVGTATAASIYPVTLNAARQFSFALPLAERWQAVSQTFGTVPARVYFIVVGFSVGYGLSRGLGWLRTKLLEVLFRYQGWTNGHSVTTKVWGVLVKLVRGPGPFSTYAFESVLPRQPLPDLDNTLDTWLGVARQLLNKDEFELTEEVVAEFRHKEGPRLQAFLRDRADKNVNWLSDYWLAAAYLSNRDPIAVKSNYYQSSRVNGVSDQVVRGASMLRQLIQFYELLSDESFPATLMQGLVPLCMNGFKYVFNSVRLPGEYMDTPAVFPGHAYIVVIRNGHYFKLDIYSTSATGQKSLLTAAELKQQLQKICDLAEGLGEELNVAVLTSQNRAVWAKQREVLVEKNEQTLRLVESCAFVFSLDTENPKDCDECCRFAMTGNGSNRWFDKCFTSIVYPNGTAAVNVEHSVIDATVFGSVAEYCVGGERYENGDVIPDPPHSPRAIAPPVRLEWDLSDVKEMITAAMQDFRQLADSIDLTVLHAPYSKGLMKKFRISPDGYIQMAIQLAFYRQHGEFVKTYEPSTHRLFALGRTETIHPISDDSKAWVQAMQPDSTVDGATKVRLLKSAVSHQMSFRLKSTQGHGCDRHLLGLYCASRELGMDIPKIFMDKAWRLPFKLSSSQTPTAVLSFKPDMDQQWWGGGFAPVCDEGYGISYVFVGDENLNINITSWLSCDETNSKKFSKSLNDAMEDMKTILSTK